MSAEVARRDNKCERKHDAFLRSLFTSMPSTIAFEVCDPGPNERVEWVVGATKALLGYTHAQWKAMSPFDTVLADASKSLAMQVITAIRKGQIVPVVELEGTHRDGHAVWLGVDKLSHQLPDGNLVIVFRDVTAEVRLREAKEATVKAQREAVALRDSSVRRMELIPAMVYEMVADEVTGKPRIVHVSAKTKGIYGLSPAKMRNTRDWMDMIHPDDVEEYEASIRESQASMEKWDHEFRVVVKGETKYLHGVAMPRREGNRVVWTGVLWDVTANHDLDEMTEKLNIQKDVTRRSKTEFAYLAHRILNQVDPQSVVLEETKAEGSKC